MVGKQLPKFILVGAGATGLHVMIVLLLIGSGTLPESSAGLMAANAVAWFLAVLFSYAGHHRWTFRGQIGENHAHVERLPRFVITSLVGLTGNLTVVLLVHSWLGAGYILATVMGVGVSVLLTFLLSRIWAFAVHEPPSASA